MIEKSRSRIWVISDVHTEYTVNRTWIQALKNNKEKFENDILVLAGDVSSDLRQCEHVLKELVDTFDIVFFTPGNHDLWLHHGDQQWGETHYGVSTFIKNSLDKLYALRDLCDELRVIIRPEKVLMRAEDSNGDSVIASTDKKVLIVPILSWHHVSWDTEPDILTHHQGPEFDKLQLPPVEKFVMDYTRTTWPEDVKQNFENNVGKRLHVFNHKFIPVYHSYALPSRLSVSKNYRE